MPTENKGNSKSKRNGGRNSKKKNSWKRRATADHEGKGGGFGRKGKERATQRNEEKAETQGMRWADCEDDEGRMEAEQETGGTQE